MVVAPLEVDPIVKSVTYRKEKRTIDKVVNPIEGRALRGKEKTSTKASSAEVQPTISVPLVTVSRARTTSSSSSRRSSWSGRRQPSSRREEEP